MSFKDAFTTFINYILQYKNDYKLLTAHVFGAFKRSFSNDYAKLVATCSGNEIKKENWHACLVTLVTEFHKIFNESPFLLNSFRNNHITWYRKKYSKLFHL